jgi:hypothetical protein
MAVAARAVPVLLIIAVLMIMGILMIVPVFMVMHVLKIIDPRNRLEVSKFGETSTGTASLSLRVRPTKRTRVLRIEVEATDPVGNAAQLARTLRIK